MTYALVCLANNNIKGYKLKSKNRKEVGIKCRTGR